MTLFTNSRKSLSGDNMLESFPEKKYRLILADPPWRYRNQYTGGSMISGASYQYQTLKTSDIMELPVKKITDDDCALFLWATIPMLEDALLVLYHWGFKFKTSLVWRKKEFGIGYYFRGSVELCLVGTRGNVKAFRVQEDNFYESEPGEHSAKPDYYYELLEKIDLEPRIELFAREHRYEWDVWGNEAPVEITSYPRKKTIY